MVELLCVAFRSVVATCLLASTTFVLGTVVGYQYHYLILRFDKNEEADNTHRRLVRWWYNVGCGAAFVVIVILDLALGTSSHLYYLLLTLLVLILWFLWYVDIRSKLRDHINTVHARWEFFWSSTTLGLVSAMAGAISVEKVFEWLSKLR